MDVHSGSTKKGAPRNVYRTHEPRKREAFPDAARGDFLCAGPSVRSGMATPRLRGSLLSNIGSVSAETVGTPQNGCNALLGHNVTMHGFVVWLRAAGDRPLRRRGAFGAAGCGQRDLGRRVSPAVNGNGPPSPFFRSPVFRCGVTLVCVGAERQESVHVCLAAVRRSRTHEASVNGSVPS